MKDIELLDKLASMIQRGQKSLEAAKVSLEKNHIGVISSFHREFINTGVFPKEFGKKIRRLEKHREKGDYSYVWTLTKEAVSQDIADAEVILKAIAAYLKQLYDREFWGVIISR